MGRVQTTGAEDRPAPPIPASVISKKVVPSFCAIVCSSIPLFMATFDKTWSAADLSKAVCDTLVTAGKLKEKPAFIRSDREAKITKVFEAAKLDGAKMAEANGRAIEVAIRNATEGEAWVDDVQSAVKGMLSDEAAKSVEAAPESPEVKAVREKMLGLAQENATADGGPPPNPAGPGGGRDRGERHSGDRQRREDRECYNVRAKPPL
jgi:hypothetical protein